MKLYSLRLKPGQDLKKSLMAFAKDNNIQAGSIVTCVGALKAFDLRMAGAQPGKQDIRRYDESYEIISLDGTLSGEDCHLHIALSDKNGSMVGGHLKGDSPVYITAEVVIVEDESAIYTRELDDETQFEELVVKNRL